ncbi:MAG TPA: tRNA (adenosine(37)-N6)-dimethylallyltransferase MiaA [Vicinamibacterales bacterium]|nr:tRNA (adenosine(37)-N6)-dimethylallyltransferase MiaA [Vicinamibacterales bacterium]
MLVAVLGPTGSGKSALGLALAERFGGEIVSCDSAAVYRGLDIGTDKLPLEARRGIPHHVVDVADPRESYTAARFARDASEAVRAIHARGRLPILVGGTGFYYRALTRGLFPGPSRDEALRERLRAAARRRGAGFLHRMVARVDPGSARRILPRDEVRLVRALEVYFLTGRPLTAHFADTVSPLPGVEVVGLLLQVPAAVLGERIAARVAGQFARGWVNEVRRLLASGVPPDAHAFQALGYRELIEHLEGRLDERAARELIVAETRKYARRQLIWFRKEPNLEVIPGPGERGTAIAAATRLVARRLPGSPCARDEETP